MEKRGVSFLVFAALFCTAKVAFSDTASPALPRVRDLNVSDIVVPAELGYVLETHQPVPSPEAPQQILIHIQESHANYEGQRHLIDILEGLIRRYGLRLVLVEGSAGEVGLASMRAYASADHRREVADRYLKLGLISAEEYVGLLSDRPLELWGVERQELYERNVEAFLESEPLGQSLAPALASFRQAAERLRPLILDPELKALEDKRSAFDAETLSVSAYADFLEGVAARHAVSLEASPHLRRFLEAKRLEATIDQSQLQKEQQRLLAELAGRLPQERWNELLAAANKMKEDEGAAAPFYDRLEQLAAASNLSLESSPHLSRYLNYIRQSAALSPETLSEELSALAGDLRQVSASTPESRELTGLLQELDLVEKLVNLQLSPEEYQRFNTLETSNLAARWTSLLNRQLEAHRLTAQPITGLDGLDAAIPKLRHFYEAARARDEALIDNTLAKLRASREPLAVLITGGFHAPAIAGRLKEAGVGLVVVAPRVAHASDDRLYRAALKYKTGHGSFEEVEAASLQQK